MFPIVGFCAGYWQYALDPAAYDACRIIAPQGTLLSTRVVHGLKMLQRTSNLPFAIISQHTTRC